MQQTDNQSFAQNKLLGWDLGVSGPLTGMQNHSAQRKTPASKRPIIVIGALAKL